MNNTKVSDALKATGGKLIQGNPKSIITGISTDTRAIKHGETFFALVGENYDGREFIEKAIHSVAQSVR